MSWMIQVSLCLLLAMVSTTTTTRPGNKHKPNLTTYSLFCLPNDTKRGASAHKCVCCLAVCRRTKCLFFSSFYEFLMNFRHFLTDFAYFCRFSPSSETFRKFCVVVLVVLLVVTCGNMVSIVTLGK